MKKMTYQEAKAVRNMPKLSEMIRRRAVSGQGAGQAIKGALKEKFNVSKRLQAKVTGFKEKLDPLNMAKFLTGGSKLAPALLGRLLGRSQEDIEYFAGGLRGRNTADRIKSLPQQGDLNGVNDALKKIYSLMVKSHENDVNRRELMANKQEEYDLEEQKRHDDLMKALGGIGGSSTPTATPIASDKSGSMFDKIFLAMSGLWKSIKGFVDKIEEFAKELLTIKSALKVLDIMSSVLRGLGLGIALVEGAAVAISTVPGGPALMLMLPWIMAAADRERVRQDPYAPENKDNPYAMMLRGEYKTEGAAAEANRAKSVKTFRRQEIEDFSNSTIPNEDLVQMTGKDREGLTQWLKDNPKERVYKSTAKASATYEGRSNQALPMEPKGATEEVAAKARSDFAKTDPRLKSIPENKGMALTAASKRMAEGKLQRLSDTTAPTVNNNTVNNSSSNAAPVMKPIPSVRNHEVSFSRMIFESTRVV